MSEWVRRSFVLIALLLMGHSWYDPDCCSGQDCDVVLKTEQVVLAGTNRVVTLVTTRFGTQPITPDTNIRESKDHQLHGCIYGGRLICLYVPPSF